MTTSSSTVSSSSYPAIGSCRYFLFLSYRIRALILVMQRHLIIALLKDVPQNWRLKQGLQKYIAFLTYTFMIVPCHVYAFTQLIFVKCRILYDNWLYSYRCISPLTFKCSVEQYERRQNKPLRETGGCGDICAAIFLHHPLQRPFCPLSKGLWSIGSIRAKPKSNIQY